MTSKPARILVALLVAVPFGQGGLCCCILGPAEPSAAPLAAQPSGSSCCQAEEGVPSSGPQRGMAAFREPEGGCACPDALSEILAERVAPVVTLAAASPALPALSAAPAPPAPRPRALSRAAWDPPPPKLPLHESLSIRLC